MAMKLITIPSLLLLSSCFLNPYGGDTEADCNFTNTCTSSQTDCQKNASLTDPTAIGDGAGTPYEIYSVSQMNAISDNVALMSNNYKVMCDLDLSGVTWNPIGSSSNQYAGTFDGNNKTISNLSLNGNQDGYGLFAETSGATLTNFKLTNVNVVNATYSTGGLAGKINTTTVSNSSVSGTVQGFGKTGGLIGNANSGISTISTSYSEVNVSCTSTGGNQGYCGGLVGYIFTTNSAINNSYATGTVTAPTGGTADGYGGLVGATFNGIDVTNSYATGNVTGQDSVGGLIGYMSSTTDVVGCFSTGDADSNNTQVGGMIGKYASGSDPGARLSNLFWFDRTADTNDCYSYNTGGNTGNSNCSTHVMESALYNSGSEPYSGSSWSTSIWEWSGSDFPTLKQVKGYPAFLTSVGKRSFHWADIQ